MVPTGESEGHANSLHAPPEGPLPGQATTGLEPEQFEELVARVGQRVVWNRGRGRPRALSLRQAVKAVVMYFRTNVTEELIAELLFTDQATISRVIAELEGIIAEGSMSSSPTWPRRPTAESGGGRIAVSVLVVGRGPRAVLRQAPHHRTWPPVRL